MDSETCGMVFVVGFIMIMVIAIVTGSLGGCYICQTTKRYCVERGYVEQWNPAQNRTEWVRLENIKK